MVVRVLFSMFLIAAVACVETTDDTVQRDWLRVLGKKKAITANASSAARQDYADALSEFLQRYPNHHRAQKVYDEAELSFARELAANGHHAEAVAHYVAVIERRPRDKQIRRELDELLQRDKLSSDRFRSLRAGMSPAEVRQILGPPLPGWSRTVRRGGKEEESWYYSRGDKQLPASVLFVGGRLVAAEYGSLVPLGRKQS